ncbi:MAG: HDOD domain-containing protein [Sedimenticola sp.]
MSINPDLISSRIPLRFLPERVINYLAQQAWIEEMPAGEELYDVRNGSDSAYLLEGQILVSFETEEPQLLEPGAPMVEFPLCGPKPQNAVSARCQSSVKLIRLPRELVESVSSYFGQQSDQPHTGIELKEDDPGDRIYLDFLLKIQSGECELPSIPDIAARISQAVDNPDSDARTLAMIIQSDPAVTTRIIKVVNSGAFGGEHKIDNCQEAVARLGLDNTRNVVISFTMKHLFHTDSSLIQKRMKQLWLHSRRVAAICYVIAKMSPGMDADRAMLSGLIHDIGAIPILAAAAEYPELLEDPRMLDRIIAEQNGEIGAMIMRTWGMSGDLSRVAQQSDDWFRDPDDAPDYVDLVILAQLLSFVGSPEIQDLPPPDLSPAYHKLVAGRLNPALSLAVLNEAEKEINAIEELLEGG